MTINCYTIEVERYVVLLPESTMTELVLPLRSEAPLDQSVSRGSGVSDSQ